MGVLKNIFPPWSWKEPARGTFVGKFDENGKFMKFSPRKKGTWKTTQYCEKYWKEYTLTFCGGAAFAVVMFVITGGVGWLGMSTFFLALQALSDYQTHPPLPKHEDVHPE